jgi:hypothetical protein
MVVTDTCIEVEWNIPWMFPIRRCTRVPAEDGDKNLLGNVSPYQPFSFTVTTVGSYYMVTIPITACSKTVRSKLT